MTGRVYHPYYVLPQTTPNFQPEPAASSSSAIASSSKQPANVNVVPSTVTEQPHAPTAPNSAITTITGLNSTSDKQPKKPRKPYTRRKPVSATAIQEVQYEYTYPSSGDFQFSHELYTCLRRVFCVPSICPAVSHPTTSHSYSFSVICHPSDTFNTLLDTVKGQLEFKSGWIWTSDLGKREDDDKLGVSWILVGCCRSGSSMAPDSTQNTAQGDNTKCARHAVRLNVRRDFSHPLGFSGLKVSVFITPLTKIAPSSTAKVAAD